MGGGSIKKPKYHLKRVLRIIQLKQMPLSIEQIRQALKSPAKKDVIERAIAHQERVRFHAEVALNERTTSTAVTEFLDWVKQRLPKDKFLIFCNLFRYPVKTVTETDKIFASLGKVFDGQNPVFKYDFSRPELNEDWMLYSTKMQIANKWRTDGLKKMRLSINSVIVVDMPAEPSEGLPSPYFYFVDITNFIDFDDGDEEMNWCIYRISDDTIIVIDDESYRVCFYETDPDKMYVKSMSVHDFGYCPAKFFWDDVINDKDPDIKLSPITTHLGHLDWLLYFMTAKQHLDTYAGYPIYSAYERDCDFEVDDDMGYYRCDAGLLRDANNQYILYSAGANDGMSVMKCPVCKDKTLSGAGTYYEVPRPGPDNDNADMRNPVQITTIDKHSLDYNTEEVERLRKEIFENITGYGGEPNTEQAMNVKQILAAVESRTAILRQFKKNFELAMEWTEWTIAKGRYHDDFVSCYIDLGTDFYFLDAQYIMDLYQTARAAQAEDSVLDALLDQYYMTKYRNSPDQLKREGIIKHLDPCRHTSKKDAAELYEKKLLNFDDFIIKLNFSTFVLRFEREQAPLIDFGKALPFDERIQKIKEILIEYGKESKNNEVRPEEIGNSSVRKNINRSVA